MDNEQKEILDTAARWSNALIANDAEVIGSCMSEDWVIVGRDGIISKHNFLPHGASGDLSHEAMGLISEPPIEICSNMAVLTGRVTNDGHFKGLALSADE